MQPYRKANNKEHAIHAMAYAIAIELIERGARTACLKQLLPGQESSGLSSNEITTLQKQIRGSQALQHPGRLPLHSGRFLITPYQRQQAICTYNIYKAYNKSGRFFYPDKHGSCWQVLLDPLAICYAWDEAGRSVFPSATHVWLLVRDISLTMISTTYCRFCYSQFLLFNETRQARQQDKCPVCNP